MKNVSCFLVVFFISLNFMGQSQDTFTGETIEFKASDGLKVTADLYMTEDASAPFIILYHQAGYSRGEYRSIAPRLNELGFNCMATDQRSGNKINGVSNATHAEAVSKGLQTEYLDAIPDIEAAYLYVKHGIKPEKIILWGSSYSAAISLFMGSTHHNNISGILAFAPGEYFKINGKSIAQWATKITCPVLITSAKSEYDNWKKIYEGLPKSKSYFLPESEGKHGSKALWNDNPSHREYWVAVENFLNKIK